MAFQAGRTRREAALATRAELERWRGASPGAALLCDGRQGVRKLDAAEEESWREWRGPRQSPKMILGEAMAEEEDATADAEAEAGAEASSAAAEGAVAR